VLDPIAGEDLDGAVVHVDREVDRELAPRLAKDEPHPGVEIEALGGEVELSLGDFPRVDMSDLLGGHGRRGLRVGRALAATSSVWAVSRTTLRGASTGPWRIGRACDARLICEREYSRSSAGDASPMVPVGKVVATSPQPCGISQIRDGTPDHEQRA
jgi:hypothetical protein